MNIQSKLQYKTARLKRKLFDNGIRKKALDIRALRLTVVEDRYGDKEYSIIDHGIVDLVNDIPGNSLQYFQGQRDSNNDMYNSGFSVYSFLPITAWPTNDAQLNKDDLIIFKYLNKSYDETDVENKIQILQVTNPIGKGTTTILYTEYNLAPYTMNIDEYPEIATIIESYRLEPITI